MQTLSFGLKRRKRVHVGCESRPLIRASDYPEESGNPSPVKELTKARIFVCLVARGERNSNLEHRMPRERIVD